MEATMLDENKISDLKQFVDLCKKDPSVLLKPELEFFKTFIESFGGKIQDGKKQYEKIPSDASTEQNENDDSDDSESEVESESDVKGESKPESESENEVEEDPEKMEEETEELPPLAPEGEVTLEDDKIEEISKLKEEIATLLEEKKYKEVLENYNKILSHGNPSAMLYTKRASVLLKLSRPKACIRDCTEALKLNPDSANAFKIRGQAYRHLLQWENAHADIEQGQKIDYDENLWEMQKLIEEKYKKIYEKKRSKIIKEEEKLKKQKEKELKKRRAAARKATKQNMKRKMESSESSDSSSDDSSPENFSGGFPGGMPNMGGMPGMGSGMPDFNSPQMRELFNNPELIKSMQNLMSNPEMAQQFLNNPQYKEMFESFKGSDFANMMGGKGSKK